MLSNKELCEEFVVVNSKPLSSIDMGDAFYFCYKHESNINTDSESLLQQAQVILNYCAMQCSNMISYNTPIELWVERLSSDVERQTSALTIGDIAVFVNDCLELDEDQKDLANTVELSESIYKHIKSKHRNKDYFVQLCIPDYTLLSALQFGFYEHDAEQEFDTCVDRFLGYLMQNSVGDAHPHFFLEDGVLTGTDDCVNEQHLEDAKAMCEAYPFISIVE